jgi:hypothetical protein
LTPESPSVVDCERFEGSKESRGADAGRVRRGHQSSPGRPERAAAETPAGWRSHHTVRSEAIRKAPLGMGGRPLRPTRKLLHWSQAVVLECLHDVFRRRGQQGGALRPDETGSTKSYDSNAIRLDGKPGIFRPDVKPSVERGRFRQGCIAPAGRGLDGFCSATTLTFSGRKML